MSPAAATGTLNYAAWLTAPRGRFDVAAAPYPVPGDDQIVVRNYAFAVNPVDWIIQVTGRLSYRWLTYRRGVSAAKVVVTLTPPER